MIDGWWWVWQTVENPTQFNFFEWKIENLEKLLFDTRFGQHIGISKFFPKKKANTANLFRQDFLLQLFHFILLYVFIKKKKVERLSFFELCLPFFESKNQQQLPILYFSKTNHTKHHFFCNTRWTCHEMSNVTSHVNFFLLLLFFFVEGPFPQLVNMEMHLPFVLASVQ